MKIILGLALFSALSSIFVTVQAEPQQELDGCRRACSEFIPRIHKFAEWAPRDEYEDIIKNSWTTCQYKCYRCALNDGIKVMEKLSSIFHHFQGAPPYDENWMISMTHTLERVTKSCYDQWDNANHVGDTTSLFG